MPALLIICGLKLRFENSAAPGTLMISSLGWNCNLKKLSGAWFFECRWEHVIRVVKTHNAVTLLTTWPQVNAYFYAYFHPSGVCPFPRSWTKKYALERRFRLCKLHCPRIQFSHCPGLVKTDLVAKPRVEVASQMPYFLPIKCCFKIENA